MSYRILGLDPTPFRHLYGLSTSELAEHGVQRHVATSKPGIPDRIELRDLELGESALLLNFVHQPAATPYRASHAIFVREGAERPIELVDQVPESMRVRTISVRAFNAPGEMVDADIADGRELESLFARLLARPDVAYLHAHYAKHGCYAARIERAE